MSQPITDLTETIRPKSDQINADDLIAGPMLVTVCGVVAGPSADQPVEVQLDGHLPYRPCKSMRRVLVACWGPRPADWPVPARLVLYLDPSVRFGSEAVGGVRISHVSGIDGPREMPLTATRGKRKLYRVDPLRDEAPRERAPLSLAQAVDLAVTRYPHRSADILAIADGEGEDSEKKTRIRDLMREEAKP